MLQDGKIEAVGGAISAPPDAVVIEAKGKYVTPGIVDVHSHMGDYPAPGVSANADGDEATNPTTTQRVGRALGLAARSAVSTRACGRRHNRPDFAWFREPDRRPQRHSQDGAGRTVAEMKFPGAKYGLKMACGENPKRVYRTRGPSTRMGNMAGYRAAWIEAAAYRKAWDAWNATHIGDPPKRDLGLETLAEALRGNINVHILLPRR